MHRIALTVSQKCSGESSRVCAVAQYAVLEANGKVHGIGEISHPSPPQPLDQFGCRFNYITMSAQGVDVPNLIKIDSAVAALRMREKKHDIACVFMAALCNRGAIIFLPCSFFLLLLSSFFPRLISAAVDRMSAILLHIRN